jgi:hypothetical protein
VSLETWPSKLDALTAAPANHRLLLENDSIRILDTLIEPGQATPLHSHCWPAALYILSASEFIRRDQNGTVTFDSRNSPPLLPGAAVWIPPLPPHTLENIGKNYIRIISVELKKQA